MDTVELHEDGKVRFIVRLRPFLPLLIFLFAFGIRLIGIGWGLPNALHNQSYHPDEEVIWGFSQQVKPAEFHFTPGVYNYGTLYLTVLRIASDIVRGYGGGSKDIWQYIANCNLAGRVISAAAGAGLAVVLFLLLRRFTRTLGAFIGAMFIAVAPGMLVNSRFQTTDVFATFLLGVSALYAVRLIDTSDLSARVGRLKLQSGDKMALASGLFAGLSAGTKYTGILGLLTLFVCIWCCAKPSRVRLALIGLVSALVAFLVATPGALFDNARFMADVRYEAMHTSQGHDIVFTGVPSGFIYHVANLIEGLGPLMLLFALVGIVHACYKRQWWVVTLLAFALPYYLLIGRAEVLFLRYTLPLYIVLAAGMGWLVGYAHQRQGKWRFAVAAGLISLGSGALLGATFTGYMSATDPRDRLATYFKAISKPDTTVGIAKDPWFYTPPLIPDSASRRGRTPRQLQEMAMSTSPHLVQAVPENPQARYNWDPALLTAIKPDYVVISSFEVGSEWRLRNAVGLPPDVQLQVDRFKAFEALLESGYDQMSPQPVNPQTRYNAANSLVHDMQYVQPVYWIWKRQDLK